VPAGCPLAEADARLTLEVSVMVAKESARKRELAMAFFGWKANSLLINCEIYR